MTTSLCVYLPGCVQYSHYINYLFLNSTRRKHLGAIFKVLIDKFCIFPAVVFFFLISLKNGVDKLTNGHSSPKQYPSMQLAFINTTGARN